MDQKSRKKRERERGRESMHGRRYPVREWEGDRKTANGFGRGRRNLRFKREKANKEDGKPEAQEDR